MINYNHGDYFTYLVSQYARMISQDRSNHSITINLPECGAIVKYSEINGKPNVKVFAEEGSFEGYSMIESKIVGYLAEAAIANSYIRRTGFNESSALGGLKVIISLIAKLINCSALKRGVVGKGIALGDKDSMKYIIFQYNKEEKAHVLELVDAREIEGRVVLGRINGFAVDSYTSINIDSINIGMLLRQIVSSKFLDGFVSDKCYDYDRISDEIVDALCLLSDTYVETTKYTTIGGGFMCHNSSMQLIDSYNNKNLTANLNIDYKVITAIIDTRLDKEYPYGTVVNAISMLSNSFIVDRNIRKNCVVMD